jgi:hypothetical protein
MKNASDYYRIDAKRNFNFILFSCAVCKTLVILTQILTQLFSVIPLKIFNLFNIFSQNLARTLRCSIWRPWTTYSSISCNHWLRHVVGGSITVLSRDIIYVQASHLKRPMFFFYSGVHSWPLPCSYVNAWSYTSCDPYIITMFTFERAIALRTCSTAMSFVQNSMPRNCLALPCFSLPQRGKSW